MRPKLIQTPSNIENETFKYIEISGVNRKTGQVTAQKILVSEAPSRARMVVRSGDIIVSLTRPHHGSIGKINDGLDTAIASSGFAVLREFDKEKILPDYLWAILRTQICLQQMLQRSSGGNYPAITEDELSNLLLPLPTLTIQKQLSAEIKRRHIKTEYLRVEAETEWQAAKQHFENQLLDNNTVSV